MAKITRRAARECAVQILYAYDFQKELEKEEFFELACEEEELATNDFAKSLFLGACGHIDEIDAKITENLRGWSLSRVSRVSLAVMRICAYELMFTDIPVSIAINEALEIDKKFDKDDAPGFINGVLNAIAKGCKKE
ncbi:MAG: transcription antitermination factor NusB [Clostridia bacterium]|nr:transcription antitermination factor NusB [Clostridia bacterium]